MAYDKDEILGKCLKAIEEHKLVKFTHLASYIEPSLSTLYEWELEKSEDIKSLLEKNRIRCKEKMMNNWQSADAAPALQIAAFKLMADEDEFNKLITNKSDVKADVNLPQLKQVIITPNGSTEQSDMADA
jgi:hypothetical protein